jgi:hypothetical protein
MKKRVIKIALLVSLLSGVTVIHAPAATASESACTTAICTPNSSGIIDMCRPLNGPTPVTLCSVVNHWQVDAVIQIVGGLLRVNWVTTLVPSLVCRLVG